MAGMPAIPATHVSRFWSRVDRNGPVHPKLGTPCWVWTHTLQSEGYGQFRVGKAGGFAHRVAYELVVGPIPSGLTLDHLCRVRCCVNPTHLEPVTMRENILRGESPCAVNARKTHCPQGHPYAGENLGVSSGQRYCRACRVPRDRARPSRPDPRIRSRRCVLCGRVGPRVKVAGGYAHRPCANQLGVPRVRGSGRPMNLSAAERHARSLRAVARGLAALGHSAKKTRS